MAGDHKPFLRRGSPDTIIREMAVAQEVEQIVPGISIWQVYEPAVKAELFSTALKTDSGVYLIDPIAVAAPALNELDASGKIIGIFVTNANHGRASAEFARKFSVPIHVHHSLAEIPEFAGASGVPDGYPLSGGLEAIAVDGGAAGEMALHCPQNGGTIVMGDALINFQPDGLELLPSKYCLDPKLMRRSLRKLLDYSFDRIFFAHGTPILSSARARLEQLLTGDQ
jgi:glyoxylase-like metal-dependent hydrolase (beta-lactamase superfamily II)